MKLMSKEFKGSPGIEMVPICLNSAALATPAKADIPTAADSSSLVTIRIGFLRSSLLTILARNSMARNSRVFFTLPLTLARRLDAHNLFVQAADTLNQPPQRRQHG